MSEGVGKGAQLTAYPSGIIEQPPPLLFVKRLLFMHTTFKNGFLKMAYRTLYIYDLGIVLLALLGLATAPAALAQNDTVKVLASFNRMNGEDPQGSMSLIGNTLYGITSYGGVHNAGTVFSVPITGGSPTVIANFDGKNGIDTYAGLTLNGTTLYGTGGKGGLYGYGTVFSVPVTGGDITVLASFNGVNGKFPMGGLTLHGNTLYGITVLGGGAQELGTVFSVPTQGGKITVLASFNGTTEGRPCGDLALSGSTLYGTTSEGGIYHDGTVFSVPITGGTPTVLATFDEATGTERWGGLTLHGSTLYGTTILGGLYGHGTVFSVPTTGGNITVLANLDIANGQHTSGSLIMSGSTLYGTTTSSGPTIPPSGNRETVISSIYGGSVFSVPISGGTPTILATYSGGSGQYTDAYLTLIGSTLYGTSTNGGANGCGMVFSVPITGG